MIDFFSIEGIMEVVKYGIKSSVVILCVAYFIVDFMTRRDF
jgi:hypothetical protein